MTHGARVLLVEDEALVAMAIEDALEALGCCIVGPVGDLDEAIVLATDAAIDCALLDVNIRGGSSAPVAAILQARGIPLLLTSGYAATTIPAELRGFPLLAKPYTRAQLRDEVQALCTLVSQRVA